MYSIYADGECFYTDVAPVEELKVLSPRLVLEDSSAGSLSFTLPECNVFYDTIARMQTEIVVKREGTEIWSGRVLTETKDFFKQRQIYCEGELAYLNDTYQPQRMYTDLSLAQFAEAVLSIHNQKVDEKRKFELGIVHSSIIGDGTYVTSFKTDYKKTIDVFNDLVSTYGCHLRVRKDNGVRKLDILKETTSTAQQTIQFGENLFDYTESYDMSNLATVLLPLGTVTAHAGESVIGEEIPLDIRWGTYYDCTGQTIDPEGYQTMPGSAYYTAYVDLVDLGIISEPGSMKDIYITCRQSNAFLMYAFIDPSGNTIELKQASTGIGFTDLVESSVEVPIDAKWLVIGGFGDAIPGRINRQLDTRTDFDTYLTVESVNNGSVYVTAKPKNRFQTGGVQSEDPDTIETNAPIHLDAGMWCLSWNCNPTLYNHIRVKTIQTDPDGNTEESEWSQAVDIRSHSFRVNANDSVVYFKIKRDNGNLTLPMLWEIQLEWGQYPTYYEYPAGPLQTHGWIEKLITWDDVDDPETLLKMAEDWLRNTQFDGLELEIKACDMRLYGAQVEMIDLLDDIRVVSRPHGLNRMFPVTRLEIPLDSPDDTLFTLSSKPTQNLYSDGGTVDSSLSGQLAMVPTISDTLSAARKSMSEAIRNNDQGVISFVKDSNGNNREMRIAKDEQWDAPDAKGWIINYTGMAFFGDGFDQEATIGIIGPDGGIVANSITTGFLKADRIRGEALTLGGDNNDYGYFVLKDASDNDSTTIDNRGIIQQGINSATGYYNSLQIANGEITEYIVGTDSSTHQAYKVQPTVSLFDQSIKYGTYWTTEVYAVNASWGMELIADRLWISANNIYGGTIGGVNNVQMIHGTAILDTEYATYYLDLYHGFVANGNGVFRIDQKTAPLPGGRSVQVLDGSGNPITLNFNEWGHFTGTS